MRDAVEGLQSGGRDGIVFVPSKRCSVVGGRIWLIVKRSPSAEGGVSASLSDGGKATWRPLFSSR